MCAAAVPVLLRLRHPDVPVPRPPPYQVRKVTAWLAAYVSNVHKNIHVCIIL